jgi:hypothetical protein
MEVTSEYSNVVFNVDGGIGRNICATSLIKPLKKKYGNLPLIVLASHPDVFINNPLIDRVYNLNNQLYFFEDYFVKQKSLLLRVEPYTHPDYMSQKKHFSSAWADLLGIGKLESLTPKIHLFETDLEMAKAFLFPHNKKPILILQTWGGKIPGKEGMEDFVGAKNEMYRRSLPFDTAMGIVNALKDKYTILHIKGQNQPSIQDTIPVTANLRYVFALISLANKIICIDSFVQHAAAAFGKKALVLWGGTSPEVLGYDSHINLTRKACPTPFCHRPNTYIPDFLANGQGWSCPFGEACMKYDVPTVLKYFEQL